MGESGSGRGDGSRRRSAWLANGLVLLVAVAITAACLAALANGLDLAAVGAILGRARPEMLGLAIALSTLTVVAKGLRWRELYPVAARPGRRAAVGATAIAISINWLLPLRLGEVAKIGLAAAGGSAGFGRGAGSGAGVVIVEKALDALALVLAAGLLVALGGLPAWLNAIGVALVGIGAAAFAMLVWVARDSRPLSALDRFAANRAPVLRARVLPAIGAVADGLTWWLSDTARAIRIGGWTLLIWTLGFAVNLAAGLSARADIGAVGALALLVALYGAAVLPSLPTRIGLFQYTCVLALTPFGVGFDSAFACSLALYAAVYVPPIVIGAVAASGGTRLFGSARRESRNGD